MPRQPPSPQALPAIRHSIRPTLLRVRDHPLAPEVHAWVALAHAEADRADGLACASAFADAADRFGALAIPFRTGYARLREGETRLGEGARRGEVADGLQEALGLAREIDAPLLMGEIEGVARRARVPLNTADHRVPDGASRQVPFGLTARELEVLALVAQGRTNKEIGSRLYMSSKTASAHVSHILEKLAARNRGEAAAIAARLGLDSSSAGAGA